MSHGSGLYIMPHVCAPASTSCRNPAASRPTKSSRCSTPGRAPRCSRRRPWSSGWSSIPADCRRRQHPHHRLGRRADVCRGRAARARPLRPAPRADLRPGRKPDDHHDAVERGHRRPRPSALARAARLGRPALCLRRGHGRRTSDDRALPHGETGEILCRGDVVMAGYWRNDEASAASLRGGCLHTGDVGAFDADGYLTLKDRSKDLIISGGSNIYPREVEEVLLTPSGRARGLGDRPARTANGARWWWPMWSATPTRRTRRAVSHRDRALQAAEGLCFRRRAAEEQLRQDAEDRVAGLGCRERSSPRRRRLGTSGRHRARLDLGIGRCSGRDRSSGAARMTGRWCRSLPSPVFAA